MKNFESSGEAGQPQVGDRVRVPDGRVGKLLWVTSSGEEAAVVAEMRANERAHPRETADLAVWADRIEAVIAAERGTK